MVSRSAPHSYLSLAVNLDLKASLSYAPVAPRQQANWEWTQNRIRTMTWTGMLCLSHTFSLGLSCVGYYNLCILIVFFSFSIASYQLNIILWLTLLEHTKSLGCSDWNCSFILKPITSYHFSIFIHLPLEVVCSVSIIPLPGHEYVQSFLLYNALLSWTPALVTVLACLKKTALDCGPHTHNHTHLISLFLPLSRINCSRSGWQIKTTVFIHQLWILHLINTSEKQQHHCTWDRSNNEVY